MNVDDMSYRQWQKRNTDAFQQLTKAQQKTARQQGYRNVGWQQVQQSWKTLRQFIEPLNLFEAKLRKGDLTGAVDQMVLEAEQAQKTAKQGIADLKRNRKEIQELADNALNKYQLL